MGIREDLLRGLYSYGFEKPSAIQQRAIMPICSGRDVIAQAQSGTGKTSMISLALCQMLDTSTREVKPLPHPRARHPDREDRPGARQLHERPGARVHRREIVGGHINPLDHGVHIVSGTRGGVFDMIKRRSLRRRTSRPSSSTRRTRCSTRVSRNRYTTCTGTPRDAGGAGVRHAPGGRVGDDETN